MNTISNGPVSNNVGYRRMYRVRKVHYAVLQNERRMIDEIVQNNSRKKDRGTKIIADVLPEIGAPPVDTLLNRAVKQSPVQSKESKPDSRAWSKSDAGPDNPSPTKSSEIADTPPNPKTKLTNKSHKTTKPAQVTNTSHNATKSTGNIKKQSKNTSTKVLHQHHHHHQHQHHQKQEQQQQQIQLPRKSVHHSGSEIILSATDFRRLSKRNRVNETPEKNEKSEGAVKAVIHDPFPLNRDHTLHQSLIADIYYNMKSVGHVRYHNKMIGTGFRVGSHYLMTAWHVIRFIINPKMSNGISDYNWLRLKAKTVCVDFGEDGQTYFALTGRYIYSNIKLDVAIVEIDRRGRRLPPPLKLSKVDTLLSKDVYFIGYSHPSDPRKRVDPFCELLDKNDTRIQAAKEAILNKSDLRTIIRLQGMNPALMMRSYDDVDLTHKFAVQCVMEQGASGAPVISVTDGKVVGILVSGVPHFLNEFEKKVPEKSATGQGFPKKSKFELCTKLSSIFESLKVRGVHLAEELFNPRLLSRQAYHIPKPFSG